METDCLYIVETEFRPGERTVIYRGNNYATAVEKTNFWDERQNTYLIDVKARRRQEIFERENESATKRANRRFDELAQQMNRQYAALDMRLGTMCTATRRSYDTLEYMVTGYVTGASRED